MTVYSGWKNDWEEAEQFIKDYINIEERELCRLLDEYHGPKE